MISLISNDENNQKTNYDFDKKVIRFGRDATNELFLNDSRISRVHCEIIEENNQYTLRDLNSTNGTYLNNQRIMESLLSFGDNINIGKFTFKFMSKTAGIPKSIKEEFPTSYVEIFRTVDKSEILELDRTAEKNPYDTYFEEDIELIKNEYVKFKKGYQKLILFFNLSYTLIKITSNEELLNNLEEILLKEFPSSERCAIFLMDDKTNEPVLIREKAKINMSEYEKTLPVELIKKAIDTKKSFNAVELFKRDKDGDIVKQDKEKTTHQKIIRTMMISPMYVKDKTIGAIFVENWLHPYCFDDFDLEMLSSFANQVAIAFENNNLYQKLDKAYEKAYADFLAEYQERRKAMEETQRQLQRITTLHKISEALASSLSSDELYPSIFEKIHSVIPTHAFFIGYLEAPGDKLTPLICYDTINGKIKRVQESIAFDSEEWKSILQNREPVLIRKEHTEWDSRKKKKYPKSKIYVPMIKGDKVVGILSAQNYDPNSYDAAHVELLQNIANQAALFIENARLFDSIKKQQQMLETLSSEIINAQENERKRISRELHDGIGQTLSAIKINLVMRKNWAVQNNSEQLSDIEENIKLVERTLDDLRRISHDLRPSMLDDFGLISTIQWYVKEYENYTGIKVKVKFSLPDEKVFSPQQEINLFRIMQEALANIAKHSKASESVINLELAETQIRLSIKDNGIGFPIDEQKLNYREKHSFGILNMTERTKMMGGDFSIKSDVIEGTEIIIRFPYIPPEPSEE